MDVNLITRTHRELLAKGVAVMKLFSGNPVEEGFRFPAKILDKAFGRFTRDAHYDPDPRGEISARRAITALYAGDGWETAPENIVITSGTSESYHYLFTLLCSPGDNVLAPCPSYPLLEHIAQFSRAQLRTYPLEESTGWKTDFGALEKRIDRRTRAVVLISPHNPTGNVVSGDEIRAMEELCARKNLALICDEVFSPFIFGGKKYPRAGGPGTKAPLVFTLDGLSKRCALPWIKLGWTAVSGADSGRVAEALDGLETAADTFLSTSTWVQEALGTVLDEGKDFMRGYAAEVERRKNRALEILGRCPKLEFTPPAGGFYLTLKLNTSLADEEEIVVGLMREKHVFAHPGYFFDTPGGPHLIVSFLSPAERLEEGLDRLTEWAAGN